jgi:ketosteroid isomerase-like protein
VKKNQNIQVVENYFAALAAGQFEKLPTILSPNVIWHQGGNGVLSGTYTGIDEVFKLFGKFMEISAGTFKIDRIESIQENSGLVIASLHFMAQKPGAEIAMKGFDVMKVVDGRITEVFLYSEHSDEEDKFWTLNP